MPKGETKKLRAFSKYETQNVIQSFIYLIVVGLMLYANVWRHLLLAMVKLSF